MAQINPTTLVNCVVLVLCYPKVFLEKKRNMFVLKFGYTPYTLSPLTPKGGIKKDFVSEKKWKLLISTLYSLLILRCFICVLVFLASCAAY